MSAARRQRRGPPVVPADSELRIYYGIWLRSQRGPERPTFYEWRRQWIADQPKNLAAWRAQHCHE